MTSFAVVTPVLNGARYIERAVESVLEQSGEIDYVVVDGGSDDGTLERLTRFGSRVRVLQLACNQAEAINAGVRVAGGDAIAILNADDWFLPETFIRVGRAFAESEAGIVVGGAFVADREGRIVERVAAVRVDRVSLGRACEIVQPAAFVRRVAFERAGGMDDSNSFTCDYDLWMRLARTQTFVTVEEPLAVTRSHADNKSMRNRARTIGEAIGLLKTNYGYVPYPWVYHQLNVLWPRLPRRVAVAASLLTGASMNPFAVSRYLREWSSFRSHGNSRAAAD